jgi:hypothetical protein
LLVGGFALDLGSSGFDLGAIFIHLVGEDADRGSASRALPEMVGAEMKAQFSEVDAGVCGEAEVLLEAEDFEIELERSL